MYKCMVKTYNLLNSIWQAHATVDLCGSVFSTDMHSSSLGAGGFLCRHKLSSQCALRKQVFGRKFGKFKPIRKNRFCFLNYSEKSIFRSTKT